MAKRPWMPLYIGDFLADTQHLSATETGIYIRLIMHCWQHGSIPLDPHRLAIISHCDSRLWRQYGKTILAFFDVVDASTAQHKRVSTELHRCAEISSKRKGAAKQMLENRAANAEQLLTHSHSQLEEEKKEAPPTPPRGGRKRKTPKTEIDANWQLSEKGRDYAIEHGWSTGFIAEQSETFRNHCLKKASTFADWEAAWRNWVLSPYNDPAKRAPAKSKAGEPMLQLVPPDPNWIELDSDEWYAWRKHRGGIAFPLDRNRGWIAPSRWPPGYKANGVSA